MNGYNYANLLQGEHQINFVNSGFSAEGTLISVSTVAHGDGMGVCGGGSQLVIGF